MVKVSFVCPLYNKQSYINEVLLSIKNQVGDFSKEFIFINDGSTDQTLQYLKKITKKWKNTKIFSQKNLGPAAATQKGIENSKGDYLVFIDSDDFIFKKLPSELFTPSQPGESIKTKFVSLKSMY